MYETLRDASKHIIDMIDELREREHSRSYIELQLIEYLFQQLLNKPDVVRCKELLEQKLKEVSNVNFMTINNKEYNERRLRQQQLTAVIKMISEPPAL